MKTSAVSFLYFLIISLFFHNCSSLNELKIAGTNFNEEISQSQNLVFTFNKDLVSDAQLNTWDSTQYIQFEPAVKGKFKWTAPNEVVFSPIAGFAPATAYKAKQTPLLLKGITKDKKYDLSAELVQFHTPYLNLTETESWWTLSKETGRREARIKLIFNYPVNAQNVSERLKLLIADKPADFKTLPSTSEKTLILSLNSLGSFDNNPVPVTIQLAKGLKAQNTSFVTQDDISATVSLPSPLRLEITDIKTGFENNIAFARIITTQELDPESVEKGFSLTPTLSAQTEITENGLVLRGDFNETDTYILQLNRTLKGVLGSSLESEASRDLFFGKMPAGISFTNKKALYMTPKGSRNMGVQIVNIPKVQVRISKLYANNILSYIKNNRWEDYAYVGDEWTPSGGFQYGDDAGSNFSDVIVDKTVDTENLPVNKGISALNIALPDDNQRKGIYLVSVNSKEEAYLGATKLVSISNIGLIAKQGRDEVWIFANSIKTNEPLSNLEITLISSNNQTIQTLMTNSDGIAHVDKLSEKAPGFRVAMVTAGNKDDFNFLLLDDTRVETSRFEVEGVRDNTSGFQAFIYGQREIYRPGETMHFNTVLRTDTWKTAKDIPLKLRLLTPNGREFQTFRKSTNSHGAVPIEVSLDNSVMTGTYTLEVYNANDVLLASHPVSVEEFIPDRIKVDLSGAAKTYLSGNTVALTTTAVNLFGPPAAGRTYEMESQLKRKAFFSTAFPQYTFDIPATTSFERERRQGTTNAQGQATEKFQLAASIKDIGVLEGKIYVTVFDENGRPVNRLHQFEVFTQPVLFGINIPATYVGVNAPLPVNLIGLNSKGNLQANTSAKIDVVRLEYQTVVEKKNEQLRYTSRKNEKIVYSNVLNLAKGQGSFKYVPVVSGEYEIRVRRPGAEHYTATSFYAYGSGYTQYSSFEVSNEGRILIETDKPKYGLGDNAKILFKTPFDGRLLVTIERDKVLEQHILQTEKKAAELKLSLKEAYLPNVFVTATLIRPLDASDMPLTVAHGFAPILVQDAKRSLPVTITAIEKSRSKTKQQIKVKTQPNTQVTLAIVDEGILQIKNTHTPDIHGYFYQKRALQVSSHDLYAMLFPELNSKGVSSSGGDGYDLGKRVNPLSNGRTELVSFWSGVLNTNGSGEVTFDINIPQFSGDLRVMAVAYKDNAFGSASKNIKVADPVVISSGVPRFLSPGDELALPVNISNTENKIANATVTMQLTGPFTNSSTAAVQKITIAPGKETKTFFSLKAEQAIGTGKIIIKVNAFGTTFTQENELNVRPASPLLKTSQSGVIAGGSQGTINLANSFIPATSSSEIVFSRSPLVQGGGKALSALLGYPFGCLEQTVSKAFPQLYFADLAKAMAAPVYLVKSGESDFNPVTNVQQAIRKAESLQLFNGGMAMWPGTTREDWWTTAYTAHFLEEACRAGFEINAKTLTKAYEYLTRQTGVTATKEVVLASSGNGLAYGGEPSSGSQVRKTVAKREAIYSLYVLSLSGQPNRAAMNYYKQNQQLLTPDSQYLLAGAFQLAGDSRSFAALLPKSYSTNSVSKENDSYASPLRNLALTLNTLQETDPDNLQIPVLSRQLSKAIQSASYLNTQEASFAVLALGKVAKQSAGSNVTADITAAGKSIAKFTGKELKLKKDINNKSVGITATGKGNLYWFAQSEGMSATGAFVPEDQGLRIRRTYLTRDGKPATTIKQNDLVIVKLSLTSTTGLPIENVVVTDLLPAGFEIENPRITEAREMSWIKQAAFPDYLDIRDDRIHFFTTAGKSEKSFYYQVRVISKGTFTAGPAAADAMYQGEYRSYSGGGKVKVE
ncbi:alpha-2-macroglobulin family protein [Dyadobacter luteus]|uniref:Alpha-2-macroglobulin family protein n=1 Tax=Dyadobacter luteus TaxID=2259619 RepID=A0A3D8Y6X4_9BACT|nr:MG2 domain-containing protein [Dyadobacter luteus]REA58650.1 alpha-2-macroglobulin family protein [Dyadobacter luteus]